MDQPVCEITRGRGRYHNRFYWRLRATNGELVAQGGEPFYSADDALRGFGTAQRLIVMPGGRTVSEQISDGIALAYQSGKVQPLLPDYSGADS